MIINHRLVYYYYPLVHRSQSIILNGSRTINISHRHTDRYIVCNLVCIYLPGSENLVNYKSIYGQETTTIVNTSHWWPQSIYLRTYFVQVSLVNCCMNLSVLREAVSFALKTRWLSPVICDSSWILTASPIAIPKMSIPL